MTVDLGGAAANDVDAETAGLALQQLVWTATAASGRPGVRLLFDGVPADRLWGQAPAGGVLRRAPMVDVVAPVWLISPQHGATVGRNVEVHVAGIVFEAPLTCGSGAAARSSRTARSRSTRARPTRARAR